MLVVMVLVSIAICKNIIWVERGITFLADQVLSICATLVLVYILENAPERLPICFNNLSMTIQIFITTYQMSQLDLVV